MKRHTLHQAQDIDKILTNYLHRVYHVVRAEHSRRGPTKENALRNRFLARMPAVVRLGLLVSMVIASGVVAPAPQTASAQAATKDIVDTAVGAGSFKTLATALQAADLVETLKGPGPFTVFAPTDDAFAKLPASTLDALLKDQAKLKSVLLYHVVAGRVTAADVTKLQTAKTVQGANLAINTTSGVKINNATVTQADVLASNGVIHVIDTVLLPPDVAPAAVAGPAPQALPRTGEGSPDPALLVSMLIAVLLVGGLWLRFGLARSR